MDWQLVVAALLVCGCAVYVLRSLLPRAWWPGAARRGATETRIGNCGGCTGCAARADGTTAGGGPQARSAPGASVIRIVQRLPGDGASR